MSAVGHARAPRLETDEGFVRPCTCGWTHPPCETRRAADETFYSAHLQALKAARRDERRDRWARERLDPAFKPETFKVPGGVLRHMSATCWLVECHNCAKYLSRNNPQRGGAFESRQEAEGWFARHLDPSSEHWKYRYPDEHQRTRLERQREIEEWLAGIFAARPEDQNGRAADVGKSTSIS